MSTNIPYFQTYDQAFGGGDTTVVRWKCPAPDCTSDEILAEASSGPKCPLHTWKYMVRTDGVR